MLVGLVVTNPTLILQISYHLKIYPYVPLGMQTIIIFLLFLPTIKVYNYEAFVEIHCTLTCALTCDTLYNLEYIKNILSLEVL